MHHLLPIPLLLPVALGCALSVAACGTGAEASQSNEFSASGGVPPAATFVIDTPATDVTVRTAPEGPLYVVSVDRPSSVRASVSYDDSTRTATLHLSRPADDRVDVIVNQRAVWTLRVAGGARHEQLVLDEARLTSVTAGGGTTTLEVRLPPPSGEVPLVIKGGVTTLEVHVPESVPVQLTLGGDVGALDFEGQRLGPAAAGRTLDSDGFAEAVTRYTVQVEGAASTVVVDRR